MGKACPKDFIEQCKLAIFGKAVAGTFCLRNRREHKKKKQNKTATKPKYYSKNQNRSMRVRGEFCRLGNVCEL